MKKFIFLFALLLTLLLVTACGGGTPAETTAPAATTEAPATTAAPATTGSEVTTAPVTTAPPTTYNVAFYDESGVLLGTQKVTEGNVPAYEYGKTDTVEWDYTMEGWSATADGDVLAELPAATADSAYYAIVSKVKQIYTVSFETGDGSAVAPVTKAYGDTLAKPQDPTLEGHRFVGWVVGSEDGEEAEWPMTVTGDITLYAVFNVQVDIKGLLSTLLAGYKLDPYSYIPESLRPDFDDHLVDPETLPTDYTTAVDIDSIPLFGYGEQWHMVLENIEESALFFNALSAVEAISAASISAFNNYFDANPADTAHHTFESGIYNVTIDFDGEVLYYILDYTATFPVVGEQTAQIAMALLMETGERTVRVQLGDANALVYSVAEDSYTFAIKYLGVRRAFFNVARDEDGNVSGHIYEHLVVEEVDISSSADFYITESYTSVVGNKADGLLGFKNYISELYDTETGRLLGYEVREAQTLVGVSVTFNTLWFDLSSFEGFETIRYGGKDGTEDIFFVNGSSVAFEDTEVGGNILTNHKAKSRRYDLEMRTRYFYAYDEEAEKYVEMKVLVPMLFVQEENYETLTDDIDETNDLSLVPLIDSDDLAKLMEDYDTLVDVFILTKDFVSADVIVELIGDKIVIGE